MSNHTPKFDAFVARKRAEFGARFDASDLDPRFVEFYESGERIKVNEFGIDSERAAFGRVGVTTGWKPSFLLVRSSRAFGSSVLLGKKTVLLAVKRGRKYEEVSR